MKKNKLAQNLAALRWGNPERRKKGLKQLAEARRAKLDKTRENNQKELSTARA